MIAGLGWPDMLLGTVTIQPTEELDYDVDYSEWLNTGDTLDAANSSVSVSGAGVEIPPVPLATTGNTVFKLWVTAVSAGTFKATINAVTALGRRKQDEIKFRVKDY